MDPQPDLIRQQIDQTRSSLTEKLETLEAEVKETVQTARQTVQGTINGVKETVQNARDTVKRTFDVEYQVTEHPWAMLGLSVVSGVAFGALLGPHLSAGRRLTRRMAELSAEPLERSEGAPAAAWARPTQEESTRPSFLDKLGRQLGDEVEKAKDLAITTLVGVVADVARRSIPALGSAVEDMMVRAATPCGAPPQQYAANRPEAEEGSNYHTPPAF